MALKNKHKKRLAWLGGIFGISLALVVGLLLLLPHFISQEMLKDRFLTDASRAVGGTVDLQKIELTVLPLPHVVVHQASFSIPEIAAGKVKSISLYPAILPLCVGKLRARRITIDTPEFKYFLPERTTRQPTQTDFSGIQALNKKLVSNIKLIASSAADLKFRLINGQLDLIEKNKTVFNFRNIQVRIRPGFDTLKIGFNCSSNLCEKIQLAGSIDLEELKTDGKIDLKNFHPHTLLNYLDPKDLKDWDIEDSALNLAAGFTLDGSDSFEIRFNTTASHLTMRHGKEKQVFKIDHLKGAWQKHGEASALQVTDLILAEPQLHFNGQCRIDPALHQARIEMTATDADADAVRHAVLAMGGDNPIVRNIFQIVRGGQIPRITFNSQADSMKKLWHPENFHLQGRLIHGGILVPVAGGLNLENVQGEVNIIKGILTGENLAAQLGNSRGRDGTLKIGLMGGDAPFHLDLLLNADLAQLPPILGRLVKHRDFNRELALIQDVKGWGEGRLILGESLHAVQAQVNVSKFELSANYQRLPLPLAVKGGEFSYDKNQVAANHITGLMGSSSFRGLSFLVELKKNYPLRFKTEQIVYALQEIFPWWLASQPALKEKFKKISSLKGKMICTALASEGPFLEPHNWRLQSTVTVKDLMIRSMLLPEPVTLRSGKFEVLPDTLAFSDLHANILDASLTLSGNLDGYREGIRQAETSLAGSLQSRANQWISDMIHLPEELRLKAPLMISAAKLRWGKNTGTSFTGKLKPQAGPLLSIDLERKPSGLFVKNAFIEDENSRATMKLILSRQAFGLSFSGHLDHTTLDNLLADNQILQGWAKGEFQTHILKENPEKSAAQGTLTGQGIKLSAIMPFSLEIERIMLDADLNHIKIASAALNYEKSDMTLNGDIKFLPGGIFLDLAVTAADLAWDTTCKVFGSDAATCIAHPFEFLPDLPFKGIIRLKSESFSYGEYKWRPFLADIAFNTDQVRIAVTEADLCGISTPGTITIASGKVLIDFKPSARKQDINHTVSCLWNNKDLISGRFNLSGSVKGHEKAENLAESVQAEFEFNSRKGRIYRFGLLAKIFAVLNITELIRGKLPDLIEEGFSYDKLKFHAEIKNGLILTLEDGILDGTSMKLAFEGQINLEEQTIDLTVLVAPFQTVNFILDHIPVVGGILNGSLYTIPLKAEGELRDPSIKLLSSSEITSRLIGVIKRTLNVPVDVIKPILD